MLPQAKILADLGTQVSDEIRCFGRTWDPSARTQASDLAQFRIQVNDLAQSGTQVEFSTRTAKKITILGTQVCISMVFSAQREHFHDFRYPSVYFQGYLVRAARKFSQF